MTHAVPMPRTRSAYRKPALARLGGDGAMPWACGIASTDGLLPMDLLRIIQCALDELGLPLDHDLIDLKLRVLEEVSEGRLAEAVHLAIVAAGKAGCGSGD
jgi:hypothetical protein